MKITMRVYAYARVFIRVYICKLMHKRSCPSMCVISVCGLANPTLRVRVPRFPERVALKCLLPQRTPCLPAALHHRSHSLFAIVPVCAHYAHPWRARSDCARPKCVFAPSLPVFSAAPLFCSRCTKSPWGDLPRSLAGIRRALPRLSLRSLCY